MFFSLVRLNQGFFIVLPGFYKLHSVCGISSLFTRYGILSIPVFPNIVLNDVHFNCLESYVLFFQHQQETAAHVVTGRTIFYKFLVFIKFDNELFHFSKL